MPKRSFFIACIFAFAALQGEISTKGEIPESGLLTSIDSEPSGIIDGCINAISGEYFDREVDLTLAAPEPLRLERFLICNNPHPVQRFSECEWRFCDSGLLYISRQQIHAYGKGGEYLIFAQNRPPDHPFSMSEVDQAMLKHGCTNVSQGVIGAQTNIRHHFIRCDYRNGHCHLRKPNGGQQVYERAIQNPRFQSEHYRIRHEILPNTLSYRTNYKDSGIRSSHYRLENSKGVMLAEFFNFQDEKDERQREKVIGSDGREVRYKSHTFKLQNPDFKHIEWQWRMILAVDRPEKPRVEYQYYEPEAHVFDDYPHLHKKHQNPVLEFPKVAKKDYPEGRSIALNYYRKGVNTVSGVKIAIEPRDFLFCRVSHLLAPIGQDGALLPKYQFHYYLPKGPGKGGCTGVYDPLLRLTNYAFNDRHRLTSVTKYDRLKMPYTVESLHWGPEETPQEIELHARTFGRADCPYKAFCRVYTYDSKGNVVEDRLYGNLTGKGEEELLVDASGKPMGRSVDCLLKTSAYSYDALNLLIETREGALKTHFTYYPGTNILKASHHADESGVYQRHFYECDDNGLVLCHVVDDGSSFENDLTGVTERKIERTERSTTYPYGLPVTVSELYLDLKSGEEKLVKRRRNDHDLQGRLIKQTTFDSEDQLAFFEEWRFDGHGNMLSHTDPLGQVTSYAYDANDNCILEEKANGLKIHSFYDFMNRLVKVEEHHVDGIRVKQLSYDLCSNRTLEIDPFGNKTRWEYDDFNRPIKEIRAEIPNEKGLFSPCTTYTYDELSHIASTTDAEGHTTEWKYTLHGKPYFIRYPDGSVEQFEYDEKGNLVHERGKNGSTTHYTLDARGRVVKKEIFSASGELLVVTSANYSAFHLLSEIDPEGSETFYTYDGQGRKSSVRKGERITYFEYDSLGRLFKKRQGNASEVQLYDALNRIIEERVEGEGKVISRTCYGYDVDGHKVRIEQEGMAGILTTLVRYDTHGIPSLTVDAEGNKTRTRLLFDYINGYGQNVYCLETIDPLGQVALTIQDAEGHVVEQIKKDPYGVPIQRSTNLYSPAGKCLATTYTVFYKGEASSIKNLFEYDCMGHLIEMREAAYSKEERGTSIRYNLFGEKEKLIKPDGRELLFSYDALGCLVGYTSSKDTFHYCYVYDKNSQPVEVKELRSGASTHRSYNQHGEVVSETLGNGLTLSMSYGEEGTLEVLTLPDESRVHYAYLGPHLKSVERVKKNLPIDTRTMHMISPEG